MKLFFGCLLLFSLGLRAQVAPSCYHTLTKHPQGEVLITQNGTILKIDDDYTISQIKQLDGTSLPRYNLKSFITGQKISAYFMVQLIDFGTNLISYAMTREYWVCSSTQILAVQAPSIVVQIDGLTVVQIDGVIGSKVMMFPVGTDLVKSLTAITTFKGTGVYSLSGMDQGTYKVTVNGTEIPSSPFTVSPDGTMSFSGPSGIVNVSIK